MVGEKRVRALLEPADPARSEVSPAPVPARELIERAEASPEAYPYPAVRWLPAAAISRRRLMIGAAAAVALAATAAYAVFDTSPAPPQHPLVIGPVAAPLTLELASDPPPAGEHLRELAAGIGDAPYDDTSGPYAYHRFMLWGAGGTGTEEGHFMSYVEGWETWWAADGSGRYRHVFLRGEFPDERSRRYFEATTPLAPRESVGEIEADSDFRPIERVPADRAGLADLLGVAGGGELDLGALQDIYRDHILPTPTRSAVLTLLADVPGLHWRGRVTDRAGRSGIAVSYSPEVDGMRNVLVFDPATGDLLAWETVNTGERILNSYGLLLEKGWTDELGARPTG
jgi:hypothetical protein